MLVACFLLVWLPYVAGVGLQERFGIGGAAGPVLVLLSLLMAWPASRWIAAGTGPDPFRLQWRRSTLVVILGGLAAMVAVRLAVGWAAVSGGFAAYPSGGTLAQLSLDFAAAIAFGAVPALAEDILTRGFPLFAARSGRPVPLLILASAILYTGNHLWRFDWGITEQLRLFCMGIAYAVAAVRANSLWGAFGLHLGWNAAAALVPLDILADDPFRLLCAAAHLAIASILLAIPRRRLTSCIREVTHSRISSGRSL